MVFFVVSTLVVNGVICCFNLTSLVVNGAICCFNLTSLVMNGLFVVSTIVVNRAFCCFNQSLVRSGLASEKVNHYENHTVFYLVVKNSISKN